MPGFLGGKKNPTGAPPPGGGFKNFAIEAAPLFASLAAGYSSGRGPYAYMDQGLESVQKRQKDKRDAEAMAAANAAFAGLMRPGGNGVSGPRAAGNGMYSAPQDPNDPTSISGDAMAALGKDSGTAGYRASLIGTESGGNWKAQNNETGAGGKAGHYGRVQFGHARLQEAMNAGAIPQGTTPEQFMNSPALQIAAENWHFGDLENQLADLVGREVNGRVMDMGALVAMGHLGGAGGARKYVESGGQYNPSDSFGTSLAEYAGTHGGTGNPVMSAKGETAATSGPVDPMTDPYVQQLMSVMAMPGLTPEQQGVVQLQLESRIQTLTAPQPGAEEEAARSMRARDAELLGYQRGTPEWNQYVVTGEMPEPPKPGFTQLSAAEVAQLGLPPGVYQRGPDGRIDTVEKTQGVVDPIADLRARAAAAGLKDGTPEFQQFMLNNGKTPEGMVIESDGQGGFRMVQGAGAGTAAAKPFTEAQSKDVVFATRAKGALETLDPIAGALTSRGEVAADWLPMGIGGGLQTDEFQVAKTAGDEFLQAILRKDTGAAITPGEQALYGETYLPRPGDSEARLKYKAEARQRAVAALEAGMSPAQIVAQEKALEKGGAPAGAPTGNTTTTGVQWSIAP